MTLQILSESAETFDPDEPIGSWLNRLQMGAQKRGAPMVKFSISGETIDGTPITFEFQVRFKRERTH